MPPVRFSLRGIPALARLAETIKPGLRVFRDPEAFAIARDEHFARPADTWTSVESTVQPAGPVAHTYSKSMYLPEEYVVRRALGQETPRWITHQQTMEERFGVPLEGNDRLWTQLLGGHEFGHILDTGDRGGFAPTTGLTLRQQKALQDMRIGLDSDPEFLHHFSPKEVSADAHGMVFATKLANHESRQPSLFDDADLYKLALAKAMETRGRWSEAAPLLQKRGKIVP